MIKYILILIALSGCAMTEARDNYIAGLNSVRIGDSYNTMLKKVGDIPFSVSCYQSIRFETCTAKYNISAYDRFLFRLDHKDIIVSITH